MSGSNRQRGAAAVEFALVLPVLFMILLAIMEFGWAFFLQASVAGAARVGVRNYTINYVAPNADVSAMNLAKAGLPDPGNVKSAAFSPVCAPGAQSTLVIIYEYKSLTGLFDGVIGSNVIVTGKGSMQCGG